MAKDLIGRAIAKAYNSLTQLNGFRGLDLRNQFERDNNKSLAEAR